MSTDEEPPTPQTPEDAEGRPVAEPTAADEPGGTEQSAAPEAEEAAPAPEAADAAPEQDAPPATAPPPAQMEWAPVPAKFADHPYTGPVQVGPYPPQYPPPRSRWRIPDVGAPQYITFACALVALFGGVAAFHGAGVGIGLALTGVATVALPMVASGREALAVRVPGAVLVAGLWAVAAVRDAGWIVGLCAITALLLTPLVLAPPSRFSGIALAAFGYLGGLAGAFRWANRGYRHPDQEGNAMRNLRVITITVGLLVVFGGLFAAADSNFAAIAANLIPETNLPSLFWRTVLTCLLFGLVLLWTYTAVARPRFDPEYPTEPRPASRFELAVPLGALNLLFAAFIALQARVLYGGDEYVMETAGLTMAEYARSGFWQLSVVAVLALAVIGVAAWKAPRRTRADRWVTRILLGGLCVMSLAIVASAMLRMSRYFESFGLTRLRLWVFTVEIWLAILFALVLVCCWKLRATWLPRAVLGSGAAVLLGLAAVNPDGVIAQYNVDRFEETGKFDWSYAAGLSADAADALAELPDDEYDCVIGNTDRRYGGDRPALAWNYGWAHGRALLEERPASEEYQCDAYDSYSGDRPGESAEEPPDLEPLDESSAAAPAPVPESAYFHWDTCDMLELTGAEEMFGTSAGGDYGVQADESRHNAWTFGADADAEEPYGHLECGYFGPGSRYLIMVVEQWDDAQQAEAALGEDRAYHESSDYEVAGLEGGNGFTAVFESSSYQEFKYSFADGALVFEANVISGPVDERARQVCEDLTAQLSALYQELA
ncbi:DUF4153 domain-containing protein [Glycomyces tenuis]|uniref:DUF4153 domain-containing protein n=1 Tax=Glycomyces tenuis TaxID=58116 RepID=UPI0003F710C0|nr:DUF4173 domain-containing protein [Glycomyces tenuis]